MQNVIIFDGPDGCGKTEMGKELSKRLGIPYFRMPTQHENWRKGKFKEALEFDQTYISQFLKQTGHSVIIDRAYPAEWVYSRVFERETNKYILRQIDRTFAEMNTHIVIPIRDSYDGNIEDEVIPRNKYETIHEEYMRFVSWTECRAHIMNVDFFQNDLEREMGYLIPLVKRG